MQKEGSYLLTCALYLLNLHFYRTQDHQPRDGPTHNGLGSPLSILPTGRSYGSIIFLIELPSSQVTIIMTISMSGSGGSQGRNGFEKTKRDDKEGAQRQSPCVDN